MLAEAAFAAGVRGPVLVVVDVRRGEVVVAHYRCDDSGARLVGEVEIELPGSLAARLATLGEPLTAVGDGATRHRDLLGPLADVRDELVVPSPAAAIRLARRRLAEGGTTVGHDQVHPWYVREADAVANFQVRDAAP